MNDKNQAIMFPEKDRVELTSLPMPEPKAGEVVVEAHRTLISTGTEGIALAGKFAPGTHWARWVKYPFRPGYLHAGRISAVGDGVDGWKVGDRVVSRAHHQSFQAIGTEHALHIPENLSDEEAAWMGLGKIAQVGVRAAQHVMGDVVVVIGLGPVGQLVVQYARVMGAAEVIAIDTAPRRLEMAAAHDATRTLNMTAGEALQPITELTGGRRADVVYEVTGHPAVFATALPLARRFGTIVLLGDTGTPHLQTLTSDVVNNGLRIVGAHDTHAPEVSADHVRWSNRKVYELFLNYLSRGQIRVKDLITHRYRPEQAAEAYAMLQRDRSSAMGVVFEWK